MDITAFPVGPFQTNAYIVACPETRKAMIIDPGVESAEKIISHLDMYSLTPIFIILTHSHWDHTANVAALQKHYSIPVYVHEHDAPNLRKPGSDGLPLWVPIAPAEPDHFLSEGSVISLGSLHFNVLHTPGHSPGGICLFEPNLKILFSGDTLFQGTIGNLSFPTANADDMWRSLEKLANLPLETRVYPGHGPHTTIANEPWLKNAKKLFGNY